MACNILNLEDSLNAERNERLINGGNSKESKGVFFHSNKKIFDKNMHSNSEDFKQLGTFHIENRASNYYPLENPQPNGVSPSPLNKINMDYVVGGSARLTGRNDGAFRTTNFDFQGQVDADRTRSDHIRNL